jgi:VNT family MFS transporter (synaptic vesicle glycoprotein 2)
MLELYILVSFFILHGLMHPEQFKVGCILSYYNFSLPGFLFICNISFFKTWVTNVLSFSRLGGSGPVIWSYFAEFQPKSKRGSMLSFMAAFWTLGNLFVACES